MSKHIFASAVFVICIVLCFTFALVSFAKFSSSDSTYTSSIGKNWQKGPVSDVEAASVKCPEGKENIINDFWQGTNAGCICSLDDQIPLTSNSTNFNRDNNSTFPNNSKNKKIKMGECLSNNPRCKTIKSSNPIPYFMWKGVNFCGKRGPNYLDMKISKDDKSCGKGYKPCGILDSLNNYLCYPNGISCPYNFMKNIKKDYPIPKDKKYVQINLGVGGNHGKMIFSNENIKGEIVNEFKIDDDTPCLSPDYSNYNHTPYPLEKNFVKRKCNQVADEKVNSHYMKIDSINYVNLYNDNQIMGVIDNLDLFTKEYNYLNNSTNLYYRNYIGMKRECLKDLLLEKTKEEIIISLINIEKDVEKFEKILIIGLAFSSVGIFVFIVFFLSAFFAKTYGETGHLFNWIGMFIISLPNIIVGFILIFISRHANLVVKYMSYPGCTDPLTSSALNKFSFDIDTGRNMTFAYTIFAVIGLVANICNIIFYKVENSNNHYNNNLNHNRLE